MVTINGKPSHSAGISIAEYLRREDYDPSRVAVLRESQGKCHVAAIVQNLLHSGK